MMLIFRRFRRCPARLIRQMQHLGKICQIEQKSLVILLDLRKISIIGGLRYGIRFFRKQNGFSNLPKLKVCRPREDKMWLPLSGILISWSTLVLSPASDVTAKHMSSSLEMEFLSQMVNTTSVVDSEHLKLKVSFHVGFRLLSIT